MLPQGEGSSSNSLMVDSKSINCRLYQRNRLDLALAICEYVVIGGRNFQG